MNALEPIRERLAAITPGPWFANRYYVGAGADRSDPDAEVAKASFKPDAEFIAHAPEDIGRLLALVEKASSLIRDLTDREECHFDHHGGCQAHGYLSLAPGEICPQQEAKNWAEP